MRRFLQTVQSGVVVVTAVVVVGCGSGEIDSPAAKLPSDAVALRAPAPRAASFDSSLIHFRYYSGMSTRERLVIRDAATWAAVWQRMSARVQPAQPVPPVDFATELVIVAAMGMRGSGGFSIAIDGAFESKGEVFVVVRETSPGNSCLVTTAITEPVTAILVPARSGAVHFSETTAVHECR